MKRKLKVCFEHGGSWNAEAHAEVLRLRGHEVVSGELSAHSADRSEEQPSGLPGLDGFDVLVLDLRDDPDGTLGGLDGLRAGYPHLAIVCSGCERTLPEAARLLELGVSESLGKSFDPRAFVRAVENATSVPSWTPAAKTFRQGYEAGTKAVERASRDLVSFLTRCDVAPAHRIRIASAAGEIVDNAARHAYDERGPIEIHATLEGSRVRLEVLDRGRGFDSRLESLAAPLPSAGSGAGPRVSQAGLRRAEALSETLLIHELDPGTRVELGFELTPVRFAEEHDDLSEVDFLAPEQLSGLVHSLTERRPLEPVSSALALTIGRLTDLAGPPLRFTS